MKSTYMIKNNMELLLLATPALLYFVIFQYFPMFGNIIAFKDFRYDLGILGSKWIGFENFSFFFSSQDALRITKNTVLYGIVFTMIDTIAAMLLAVLLYEVLSNRALKYYQTVMMFPRFLSWVVVGYLSYTLLNPVHGILNQLLDFFGTAGRDWYSNSDYWPWILTITQAWKNIAFPMLLYYASLLAVNPEQFEAAELDGADWFQKTRYVSLPALTPVVIMLSLLAIGNIFKGDFGLFYQLTRDVGTLYPTTDIIDTYVFRSLKTANPGMTTAVTLYQSVVGLVMILISNFIIRKINPEHALF